VFSLGLAVRLVGVLLIWLGDGHDSLLHKSVVVVGVALSIGGIGMLRYLLISGFRRKK
jgi:NADH:ubiquinone oxidoreductase subunit 4 (subunit M)